MAKINEFLYGPDRHVGGEMKSYFHTSLGDTVIFQTWITSSGWKVLAFCVLFCFLSFMYEFIRSFRTFLIQRQIKLTTLRESASSTKSDGYQDDSVPTSALTGDGDIETDQHECRLWRMDHFYQTLFHVLQVFTAYILMMGFMILNIWICLSIILGAGLGYFAFFSRSYS